LDDESPQFHPQQIHLTKRSRVPRRRSRPSREPDKVATRESVQRARAGAGDWRDGLHPRTRRREAGANTFRRTEVHLPHLSFGGVGNGNSPSFQFPTTTPQNTKADAAAAKVAKKVDPAWSTSRRPSPARTAPPKARA